MQLEAIIKPTVGKMIRRVKAAHTRVLKAEDTAVRVEGYRAMRVLKAEIRRGAPGGRRFAPLSTLARRSGRNPLRLKPDRPLYGLAQAVGYESNKRSPITLKVGFVGRPSSDTWRKLALLHQRGFTFGAGSREGTRHTGMDERKRSFFRYVGGALSERAQNRRHLFLRKATRTFRTPARPIIDPFWAAHRNEAARNIRDNFRRKMAGERI